MCICEYLCVRAYSLDRNRRFQPFVIASDHVSILFRQLADLVEQLDRLDRRLLLDPDIAKLVLSATRSCMCQPHLPLIFFVTGYCNMEKLSRVAARKAMFHWNFGKVGYDERF